MFRKVGNYVLTVLQRAALDVAQKAKVLLEVTIFDRFAITYVFP
jgi:hypothetical protein